jgi:hypothetical protein
MATIEKRKNAKGEFRYRVRIRLRGEKPRTRTFKRKTDAELSSKKVESDLGHGAYVPTTADRRRTLADLIEKFIKEYLPIRWNNADERNISAQLKWWRDNAGHVTIDKLTPQAIAGFKRTSSTHARKTIRRLATGLHLSWPTGGPCQPTRGRAYHRPIGADSAHLRRISFPVADSKACT